MQLGRLKHIALFTAASVVSGLALAFLIVAIRPGLLRDGPPSATRQGRAAGAPPRVNAPISYAAAVERAAPAVVNISTERLVAQRVAPSPLDQLFGDFGPSYRPRIEHSLGSGVIIDKQGDIVTNQHVIAGADEIFVQLADGRTATAKVVGSDPDTDLALLKTDLKHLPVMPLGRSDRLRVGDVVLAIGSPLGLSQTVTHGIVSATSRSQLGVATFENFIQTDAPINFGNSGGALINTDGQLIGINTAMVAPKLGVEGIGFAIPVNMVRGVVAQLRTHGRVIRGWVGIVPEDITDDQAARLGLAHGGVVVANLYVKSPAQQAGLRPGDLLIAINGKPVRSAQGAVARVATRKPGSSLTIRAQRGSQIINLKMRVRERPRIHE